jgi:hypothetical protein
MRIKIGSIDQNDIVIFSGRFPLAEKTSVSVINIDTPLGVVDDIDIPVFENADFFRLFGELSRALAAPAEGEEKRPIL